MSAAEGRLRGKVAVVTGAASGIGAETARLFVENGAAVVAADLQEAPCCELVAELGDSARFARCDVTDEAEVAAAIDLAVAEFGQLDVMVNNAGVAIDAPLMETSEALLEDGLAVKAKGACSPSPSAYRGS